MPAWYDIVSLEEDRSGETCEGIDDSRRRILALIEREVRRGISPRRIVLAGFSQGGAMALYTGLHYPAELGGIAIMSGYMVRPEEAAPSADALRTPVLFMHGDADPLVKPAWAGKSVARVRELGVASVDFKTYRGLTHSASPAELADLLAFLKDRLPPDPAA
jgi:lysophospholipase-2